MHADMDSFELGQKPRTNGYIHSAADYSYYAMRINTH